MNVSIKVGNLNDLQSINDIYNHYVTNSNATFDTDEWKYKRRLDWFEQFGANPKIYNLFVAKSENNVIGFAYNSKFKEKAAYVTSSEVTIYIKPGFGGNGIGVKLYEKLLPKVVNSSIHRLYAVIAVPNSASIRLHEKFEFNIIGTMSEVGFKNGKYHSVSLYPAFRGYHRLFDD